MSKIKIKRGNENSIPQLEDGELGFTKDSKKLFVGLNGTENYQVNSDTKVSLITDTTTNSDLPIVFANGASAYTGTVKISTGMTYNPSTKLITIAQLTQQANAEDESGILGEELLTADNWILGDGWSGSWSSGYTHTSGTATLSKAINNAVGNSYHISFTITGRTAGSVVISFGGVPSIAYTASGNYGPKTITVNAPLEITPTADFNGTIKINSLRLISPYNPIYVIKGSDNQNALEIRSNLASRGNSFIGVSSGMMNTTGSNNTANGYFALRFNTTGSYNTANGYAALYSNTTGSNNTANGYFALLSNTTGSNNTASGYYALRDNTTGSNNTANGYYALRANTTGSNNTANGYYALRANTTGSNNTASGYFALYANTTGSNNTANGYYALRANTTGSNNTASGYFALYANTTGSYNTASGYFALYANTTGSYNTANGYQAGYYLTNGVAVNSNPNNSVYLGAYTKAKEANGLNEIVIGYEAIGKGSNTAVLGNDNITETYLKGNVSVGDIVPTEAVDAVGYIKSSLGFKRGVGDNTNVLLDGGGIKAISDFNISLAGNGSGNSGKVYGVATQNAHDQVSITNGVLSIHKATNAYRGTVRGTPNEVGKISVDSNGIMSVNGWGTSVSTPNMVELTYQQLVDLRNNNQLVKGTQYCITDFVTTTNVNNDNLYRSSEHSFDVIITADSENTLNENARARVVRGLSMYAWTSSKNTFYTYTPNPNIGDVAYIDETSNGFIADVQINFEFIMIDSYIDEIFYRDEDADMVLGMNPNHQYFIENHAKVESWELKYCIDNDVDRFEWADRNGKGVIYYMKDEHLNECNYDFKNIMFHVFSDYNSGCWKTTFNNFPLERINTVAKYPQSGKFVYTFFIKTADASVIYDMENNFPHKNKILHQTVLNNFYTEKLSFLVFDLYKNSCKNNVFTNCKYGSFIGVEDVNISNSEIMVGTMVKNINLVDSDIFVLENVSNVKIAGTIQGSKLISVSDTTISGNVDYYYLHDLHSSQITVGINENCLADFCNLNEPNFENDQWIGFVCCMNSNVKGIKFDGCKPVLVDVDTN